MHVSTLRADIRGRRHLRRVLLVVVATVYSVAAVWLAIVLMWHAQAQPVQQADTRRPSDRRTMVPSTSPRSSPPPLVSSGAPVATEPSVSSDTIDALTDLRARGLVLPVADVTVADLQDTFSNSRGNHSHEAIDILAPRGTPVLAVEGGRIARLFVSKAGGTTIYLFDPTERYTYYYAHLDRYAEGLREGDTVTRGQVIGYVGTSGNAPPGTPHLHFGIFQLGPEKHWWEGTPIDPFPVWR